MNFPAPARWLLLLLPALVHAGTPEGLTLLPGQTATREPGRGWQFLATSRSAHGRPGHSPVYATTGRPVTPATLHILTGKISVQLAPGTTPEAAPSIATAAGLAFDCSPDFVPGFHFFLAADPSQAPVALDRLRQDPRVLTAVLEFARHRFRHAVPNDPLFSDQWHLRNTVSGGVDLNLTTLWGTFGGAGTRGAGIRVGVIDDALQTGHPDLRTDTTTDKDWSDNDDDPNPGTAPMDEDFHGTSVGGVIAARGNNARGVCGVAPDATLVGLRLIGGDGYSTDSGEAEAFGWLASSGSTTIQIKNNSWGTEDGTQDFGGIGSAASAAITNATTTGRNGLGTIFLFAGGNGGKYVNSTTGGEDSNMDSYAGHPGVIAVAAVNEFGIASTYSEPGANILVCAPSDDSDTAHRSITTTDVTGDSGYNDGTFVGEPDDPDYTSTFGGTSSACPAVSGVCALMLQTNPGLGWRDVQEILIRTSRKNNPTHTGWFNNAAGFHFNRSYGAGLVDAAAACSMAATWANLGPRLTETKATSLFQTVDAIPDNSATGVSRTFTVTAGRRVERVLVTLSWQHPRHGDLRITLTSPSGTVSPLLVPRQGLHSFGTPSTLLKWSFSSVHFWGEPAAGTWTVKMTDTAAGSTGSVAFTQLEIFGTATSGYPAWAAAAGLTSTAVDAGADPDHDASANVFEYLAGTTPSSAASVARLTVSTASPPVLSVPRAAANLDATLELQTSPDLTTPWVTVVTIAANQAVTFNNTAWSTATPASPAAGRLYFKPPSSTARRTYYRLKATLTN